MGIMVYFLMTSLGEMATFSPTTGSFVTYSADYVDPAFGFAMGWNYWFNWTITITVDAVSCGVVMNFWFPHLPSWIFSSVVFVLIALINWLSVKSYGETEYWLSFIKVITIGFFLVVGFLVIFGIMGGHSAIGLQTSTVCWWLPVNVCRLLGGRDVLSGNRAGRNHGRGIGWP